MSFPIVQERLLERNIRIHITERFNKDFWRYGGDSNALGKIRHDPPIQHYL